MGSRKEEERNEKIIRGLMKLPPNRRCINCNSLGPQYVCTNFWTFVCMTCSGIQHFNRGNGFLLWSPWLKFSLLKFSREFTHRVKSVSMAKFTSQEVDALQNGGNQSPRIHEDDTRRASSYHSYSQSPPYDYQYEDRRYGKQAATLTRKPGSDKVRYEGKLSSIIYSPGRFSDHAYDDRFANEESGPRISDFSVTNGGEQFKADVPRSGARSSEDVWSHAINTSLETNSKRDVEGIHCPQRTTSLGSTGSNLSSLRSYSSGGLVDFFSESFQASVSHQNKVSCAPQPSDVGSSVSSDLSKAPVAPQPFSSSVDLFQLPAVPSQATSVDLFQSSALSAISSFNESQPTKTSQSASVDFFMDLSQQPSAATSNGKSLELSVPKNGGWATFDTPQLTTSTAQVEIPTAVPSTMDSLQERFDPFSNLSANMEWPSAETSSVSVLSSVTSNLWHNGLWNGEEQVSVMETNTHPWNAFKDSGTSVPVDALNQGLQMHNPPSNDDQFLDLRTSEGSNKGVMQGIAPVGGFDHDLSSHFVGGSSHPPMAEVQPNEANHKSTNPFDYPFDSDVEHNNLCQLQFLDVSSLQAALPDSPLPPTFQSGIAEPWISQKTVNPYISAAGQGGLTFMAAPTPSSQIPRRDQLLLSGAIPLHRMRPSDV
ncbi:hypothetical protein VNO77_16873 [Canavalia gladiata]|uniref:Arf-GAP domain-containing protein n=1 Tax=Canavalia gladiata TaxID=3824 RepID=A0AAN9QIU8_CANGL